MFWQLLPYCRYYAVTVINVIFMFLNVLSMLTGIIIRFFVFIISWEKNISNKLVNLTTIIKLHACAHSILHGCKRLISKGLVLVMFLIVLLNDFVFNRLLDVENEGLWMTHLAYVKCQTFVFVFASRKVCEKSFDFPA